jgi:hypothetical protein
MKSQEQFEAPDWGQDIAEEAVWSEILPGLWQGGTAWEDDVRWKNAGSVTHVTKEDFDFVVTMYGWAKPVDWLVSEYRYAVYDSDIDHMDLDKIGKIVNMAHDAWKNGERVLIRCQAGWNRSGLVMALVLMKEGMSAEGAIDLIRQRRSPYALCNKNFVEFLQNLDKKGSN